MFTLVHRVLLDSLPVRDPGALVEVGCVDANKPDDVGCETSYPGFRMFRDDNDVLAGLFAFAPLPDLNVVHEGRAELATALLATGDMYDVLGVVPAAGRLLAPVDDAPSAPIAVVLSHGYWQRRFNADPVLTFTTVVAFAAGVLVTLGSVWHLLRISPSRQLRDAAGGHAVWRLARLFVPIQVALATAVLIGAALLLQTFTNILHSDDGFHREQLVTLSVRPQLVGYDRARVASYVDAATTRLEALPGVISVTRSSHLPGGLDGTGLVQAPGFESAAPMLRTAGHHHVGARVSETWGLTLLRGRDLGESDDARTRSALVNESFATHFFQGIDVIGRQFSFAGDDGGPHTIVGVVADARDRGPRLPIERVAYTHLPSEKMGFGAFAVRGHGSEAILIIAIGRALREIDPQVPVVGIQSMDVRVQESLRRERLLALLSALFGALALVLVAIGLFGLLAGAVAHRTREIGIRLALGGGRRKVLLLFLRQGLSLVALGLLAGLGLGALLGRFLRGELYGVASTDPVSFVAAACVLAVTSIAACLVPAVRAARTDPMSALRED